MPDLLYHCLIHRAYDHPQSLVARAGVARGPSTLQQQALSDSLDDPQF